jgi:hypothetical protein
VEVAAIVRFRCGHELHREELREEDAYDRTYERRVIEQDLRELEIARRACGEA